MNLSYKEKLLDPRWQKKRLGVLNREEFSCQYCGEKEKTLHIHHICYNKSRDPWDIDDSALLCLCEECHSVGHLKNLTEKEGKLIDAIQFSALIYNSENRGINNLVKVINQILLHE